MSNLLLDEKPMMVLPSLAKALGNVNKAIIVQHIHWIVTVKLEHDDDRTLLDGEMWCKLTYAQWKNKLCWLSNAGVRKLLSQLEDHKILISCKPNSVNGNHTKWYRIDHGTLNETACYKVANPELPQSSKRACHKVANLELPQSSKSNKDRKIFKDFFKESESEGKNSNLIDLGDRLPSQNIPTGQKNQSGIAPKNKSGVRGQSSAAARSTNERNSNTPHDWVRGVIEGIAGDRYQEFINHRVSVLSNTDYWRQQLNANPQMRIIEATVLQQYAKKLPNKFFCEPAQIEAAEEAIAEEIKTHVEMSGVLSISGANQGQDGGGKDLFEDWLAIYKNDPFEVKKIAGHRLQEFISWKNAREEELNVAF